MPTTRPDTAFVGGVCSACLAYNKRALTDWDARKKELEALLERGRNPTGYDCIVPSSGGKDSHWQVLTLLEMGANPLVVTATTCDLTPAGRRNINNLAKYADTSEVTPDKEVRRKLNRLALEMVGDISWPEHISIHRIPFSVAAKAGIPLIFYGECPTEAYGGPPGSEDTRAMTQRWVSEFGGFLGLRPSDMVGKDGITEHDMAPYGAPTDADLKERGIEAYFLGQFLRWDSHRNAQVAKDAGMHQCLPGPMNWWAHENVDNFQTGVHDYFGFLKYGYGRATAQLSVDVRAGLLTREAAMEVVQERDGLFPTSYMGEATGSILGRIGVTQEKFISLCNAFMNKALFAQERVEWGQHLTLKEFGQCHSRAA
jgi:N-acetyl sugar amidotransferase